ncbi:hypothetical protein TSAR_016583 [Trichomalopsis sarcophagae]|uniref:Uncharacterized protein n=1 Tax=Trichomalopsis sarcophagae TaxID=543379 RepID=A0A232EF28_9HYME|nr:hypothetical protein TSAR_016583 [Trichomalopsis sarcophagae]
MLFLSRTCWVAGCSASVHYAVLLFVVSIKHRLNNSPHISSYSVEIKE